MKKLTSKHELIQEISPEGYTEIHYKNRPKNLSALMESITTKWPDKEAFVDGDQRITYFQFCEIADRVSAALQQICDVKKGDRVALLLSNGIPFVVTYFGIVRLGAVVVPLNTRHKGIELSYEINDSGAKILISEISFYKEIEPLKNHLKTISHIFIDGDDPPPDTHSLYTLTTFKNCNFSAPEISEWDLLNIMYTSGTTGQPKGAMHFHRGIIGTAILSTEFLNYEHGRDRILCIVPLFHVTGLSCNFIAALYAGVPVVFMRKFNAEQAMELIQKECITSMVSVISIYWLILNNKNFNKYDLSSLREILYGGSPAAEDVIKQMREKLPGVKLHNGYGLTETHALDTCLQDKDAISHIESVGQILPLVEMKIVDTDGKELPTGETGELLIKGCKVVRGYWNKPDVDKRSFSDGWLYTGDVARIDSNGYVYIMDRIKDMINRGGEKIYSIEVENVLYANPKILEAAVFGVPDMVFGEQVWAAVVTKPGQNLTEEEILDFCSQRLADYKVPKSIIFLAELPRNPGGKVVKSRLKNL